MSQRTLQVNNILGRHSVLGSLLAESDSCYQEEKFFSALACLFIAIEAALKFGLDSTSASGMNQTINDALAAKLISETEHDSLHQFRQIRNGYFHNDHYSEAIVADGIIYQFSEAETHEFIYQEYSDLIFNVVERIVKRDSI